MIIRNGMVFTEEGVFDRKDLYIEKGRFVDALPGDRTVLDAEGLYVVPGFVDIHTHGAVGHDFCDASAEGLRKIAAYEKSCGVTSFCPTSMTYPEEKLAAIFQTVNELPEDPSLARIAGIHMEGPYLSPDKCGAQNPAYLDKPDSEAFRRLNASAGGKIRLITLAPEIEGAMDFLDNIQKDMLSDGSISGCATHSTDIIQKDMLSDGSISGCAADSTDIIQKDMLSDGSISGCATHSTDNSRKTAPGIHISLGHSGADYETAAEAFRRGADHVTHLFNAMPPFHHRDPGIIGAAADTEHVCVEVICDLIHLHPSIVRAAYRMFGPDRMILISDSMEATGMPDGIYELGGQRVYKKGSRAALEDATLAGSASNLYQCFQNAVSIGIPLEHALKMVTVNPARSIGMETQIGCIRTGALADLLLLDKNLQLVRVL